MTEQTSACLCLLLMAGAPCVQAKAGSVPPPLAQAAAGPGQSGRPDSCTLHKGVYACDWDAFRTRFTQVHTVAVQVQPLDRPSEARLRHLVEALGKSVAPLEQTADLIFRVAPAQPGGVAIGPADQALATLLVSAPGADGGRETLLWAETFAGQADRPWPTVVNALASQFEARFKHGK